MDDLGETGRNMEEEFRQLTSKNEWVSLYHKIRARSNKNDYTCLEANKPQNKVLNRYRDVIPYDHSRIVLERGCNSYINANLVVLEKAERRYILTQGPLVSTVSHFWLMVWEQDCKAIIMLNKLIEKKQEKCYQYWPISIETQFLMEDIDLSLEYISCKDYSYYLKRIFRLKDIKSGTTRDIIHFHYTTWPDFGVPSSPAAFLEFLKHVREAGVLENSVGPAVVHCSAGIGRSGTFCLVDACLILIEKYGINSVDAKSVLLEMRKYRMGLIQTPDQLKFSFKAIIEGCKTCEQGEIIDTQEVICESSSEEELSDETPPLPPRRHESLMSTEKPIPNDTAHENEDDDKPDVMNPQSELRRRIREEKTKHLLEQVEEIKRKQHASEKWTDVKKKLCKTLFFTSPILVGVCFVAYFYFRNL